MHEYSHVGAMLSRGAPRWVSTFIRRVTLVLECERRSLWICQAALLCLVMCMLLVTGLMLMERRCTHVSTTCNGHMHDKGDGNLGQMMCFPWLPMYWPYWFKCLYDLGIRAFGIDHE